MIKKTLKSYYFQQIKNINKVFKQAKKFKVKNIIISDFKSFQKAKLKHKNSKINIFANFKNFKKFLKRKMILL